MNFQKNIFLDKWKKSLKKNINVLSIDIEDEKQITVWFIKRKTLFNKIKKWLINNNYKFDIVYSDGGVDWSALVLECQF